MHRRRQRQHGQPHDHHQHQRRCLRQPCAQAAEGDFHVPGFQLGTAVEVQAEAGAAVERADQRHRGPGQQIEAQPHPRRGVAADQRYRHAQRLGQGIQRHEHEHQRDAGHLQHHFEMPAHQRQQRGMAIGRPPQHAPPLPPLRGVAAFEQVHRHQQRTRRAQPAPQQVTGQRAHTPMHLRAQGLRGTGHRAERAARYDVQRDALEHRLQPPHQQCRQPEGIQPPPAQVEQHEHRAGEQQPRRPDGPGVAPHQRGAQLHRLPVGAGAQRHVQLVNAHRHPRGRRATASRTPAPTARRTR